MLAATLLCLAGCGGGGSTVPTSHASGAPGVNPSDIDWPTFAFSATRSGENTSESQLTPITIGNAHLLWSRKIGDASSTYADAQPVVAANVPSGGPNLDIVYAGDEHGFFVALNAANGTPLWTKHLASQTTACADVPDETFGITSTPAIDRTRNRIYVVDGSGKLMAFDLATGNVASGWPSNGVQVVDDPTVDHVWSGLTFDSSTNLLYVPTASYCDYGTWNGAVRAVNVQAATVATVFYFATGSSAKPAPPATSFGGSLWSWGGIAIDTATHNLYAAVGNVEPTETVVFSDSMMEWNSALAPIASFQPPNIAFDSDFGGSTVVYDDAGSSCVAALRKDGTFFVFNRAAIGAGPTFSLAMAPGAGDAIATPAHSSATHLLYLNNPQPGAYGQGLYAFQIQGNCTLSSSPAWSQGINATVTPVTVAGGVVYDAAGAQLLAFNAATGAQLWSSGSSILGSVQNGAAVVDGRIYVVDWKDTVYAFGL